MVVTSPLSIKVPELKNIILEKCEGFKNLNGENSLRWVVIKRDITPLTKKGGWQTLQETSRTS